jgi:hypothetical protein
MFILTGNQPKLDNSWMLNTNKICPTIRELARHTSTYTHIYVHTQTSRQTDIYTNSSIFWAIMSCSMFKIYWYFRGTCLLHLQGESMGEVKNWQKAGIKQNSTILITCIDFQLYKIKRLVQWQWWSTLTNQHPVLSTVGFRCRYKHNAWTDSYFTDQAISQFLWEPKFN